MTFLLIIAVLSLVPREEPGWRIAGVLLGTAGSFAVALRVRVKSGAPKESLPPIPEGMEDRVAALVSHAVDHADRSAVAWATITVTAHSLVAIALSKLERPETLIDIVQTMTIYGMAMLILASTTLPGAYAISTSAERSRRAVAIAREYPKIGQLYGQVYREESSFLQAELLGITMTAFGTAWLWFGMLLLAFGAVLRVI